MDENINNEQYNIPTFLNSTTKIVATTAILYFLIAKLSLFIFVTEINILPFFPAIGFAIAAVLLLGRKVIFGVAIGCLLFSISLYKSDFQNATTFEELIKPIALCIVRPIIASLNTFLVSYLSQLWCKKKYPFDCQKNVIFFAFASLLGTFISTSIGFISLVMTPYFSLDNCILIWSNMLRGNAMGTILFTPFVLSWLYDTKEFTEWSAAKKTEAFLLIISTLSLSLYIFESHANNETILFFLLIWAASRFGMKIITLVVIIITIIATYCTGHHMGGFVFSGWNNNFLMLQLFLFVNMVSVLFLKAILEEKENEENKLKISEQNLGLEKNILKATIESPIGISVYSLDHNHNYLSFNSTHKNNMLNEYDAKIKIGDNLIELITDEIKKEEVRQVFLNVLKGNTHNIEHKNHDGEYWDILVCPTKNKENKIVGTTSFSSNVTKLKLNEIQLEKNNFDLNERIKELGCLYNIFKINNNSSSTVELIQACLKIIPDGFQFPEITNCRIILQGEEFNFNNDQKTNWSLSSTLKANGIVYGKIEVGYFEEKEKKNTFLVEETHLLETIADILSKSLESNLAAENLAKSEEKFRSIFENFEDIYFIKDLHGIIIDISPSVEKHFHIKREELIGKSTYPFFFDPTEADRFYEIILQDKQINDYQERFVTTLGETLYFSLNAKLRYDSNGEPEFIEGTMRNVNERINNQKQLLEATEKIKESEGKFRSIYENFQDIYLKTDMNGTVLDVSPSFEKYFLRPSSSAIGKSVLELYYEEQDRITLIEKLKTEGHISDFDARFIDAKGNIVFFSLNARFIYDNNGNPIYVEGSMRNVNERVAVQEEMILKNRKLEFQNTELEQFAYIASHDLQEPLITVIHCSELLEEELIGKLEEDQQQYLNFIRNSTSRMQLLVKGLLDYSRIGKERKTTKIDCNTIVSDVISDMNSSINESNALIEYENLPVIEANPTEMRQLFQNMISNAIKFRKKENNPKVKIAAVQEDENWVFSIADNGIGIKNEDVDKVFVIFKRLHNRNEYQGTGIGLSHCKKIIEQYDGRIWVESKFNEGSTFKWTLPLN